MFGPKTISSMEQPRNRAAASLALMWAAKRSQCWPSAFARDGRELVQRKFSFKRLIANPITSRLASAIAGEDPELIGPLMESLGSDLLLRDDRAARLLGVRMHSLDAAIDRALRDWEAVERLAAREPTNRYCLRTHE